MCSSIIGNMMSILRTLNPGLTNSIPLQAKSCLISFLIRTYNVFVNDLCDCDTCVTDTLSTLVL